MEMVIPESLRKGSKIKAESVKKSETKDDKVMVILDDLDIPDREEKLVNTKSVDDRRQLSVIQKEKLENLAKSLRTEEAEVVIDNLPIELIFRKIEKEIIKNREFIQAISGAMSIVK